MKRRYSYKPWYLRYIGDVDITKEIMKNGRIMEEYLNNRQK